MQGEVRRIAGLNGIFRKIKGSMFMLPRWIDQFQCSLESHSARPKQDPGILPDFPHGACTLRLFSASFPQAGLEAEQSASEPELGLDAGAADGA